MHRHLRPQLCGALTILVGSLPAEGMADEGAVTMYVPAVRDHASSTAGDGS
jgi:hypothetical protein